MRPSEPKKAKTEVLRMPSSGQSTPVKAKLDRVLRPKLTLPVPESYLTLANADVSVRHLGFPLFPSFFSLSLFF